MCTIFPGSVCPAVICLLLFNLTYTYKGPAYSPLIVVVASRYMIMLLFSPTRSQIFVSWRMFWMNKYLTVDLLPWLEASLYNESMYYLSLARFVLPHGVLH